MGSVAITDVNGVYFKVFGTQFRQLAGDSSARKTTRAEILILKSPDFLRKYDKVLDNLPIGNVVEFGIAEGGSLLYFAQKYANYKFVGIDLRPPNEEVIWHINRLGLKDRVKLYYETDQADKDKCDWIMRDNFNEQRLGCIIDDASHMYSLSKKTFENHFGSIATGGTYCLEDWSWAHEAGQYQTTTWLKDTALSNLVFEIVVLMPSTRGYIDSIDIDFNVAFVKRGGAQIVDMKVDDLLLTRGKKLVLI